MEYILLYICAFFASGLTVFSGFGLGTILLPVFALFFPLNIAVALTAVVHLVNNLLKLVMFWKNASWRIVLRFGIPAVIAALIGAKILFVIGSQPVLRSYSWAGRTAEITALKILGGVIIILFSILENLPGFQKLTFPPRYLSLGGFISGFLGGLSGHQGAMRSAFLIKCGLSKEAFIATGVVIACLVDFSRLLVYGQYLRKMDLSEYAGVLAATIAAAFFGVLISARLLKKTTIRVVQKMVSFMLLVIGALLIAGLI
jgi:uncharacterized membrane protein YfcA